MTWTTRIQSSKPSSSIISTTSWTGGKSLWEIRMPILMVSVSMRLIMLMPTSSKFNATTTRLNTVLTKMRRMLLITYLFWKLGQAMIMITSRIKITFLSLLIMINVQVCWKLLAMLLPTVAIWVDLRLLDWKTAAKTVVEIQFLTMSLFGLMTLKFKHVLPLLFEKD